MSLFFETVRIEDGIIHNALYHNRRLNETIAAVYGIRSAWDIRDHISVPKQNGIFKCRITYDTEIREVTLTPYRRKNYRVICCVETGIDYPYKSTDRRAIETLYDERGECDDILMVRDGLLTDTSIANIALYDGREWLTPRTPLLPGTMRAALLESGKLKTADLTPADLDKAVSFAVMNAMTGFYELKQIIFI